MIALRYAYVLALSAWFGGTIVIAFIAAPADEAVLRRFFYLSYAAGLILLLTLLAMGLLGPRPSRFAARFGIAVLMCGATIYSGRYLHRLTDLTLGVTMACSLALLFWEALDGTRAA